VHLRLESSPVVVASLPAKDRGSLRLRVSIRVVASPVVDDSPDAGHRSIREVFPYPEEGCLMQVDRDEQVDRKCLLTYGGSCSSLG